MTSCNRELRQAQNGHMNAHHRPRAGLAGFIDMSANTHLTHDRPLATPELPSCVVGLPFREALGVNRCNIFLYPICQSCIWHLVLHARE